MSKLKKALEKAKEARKNSMEVPIIDREPISSPLQKLSTINQGKRFDKVNPTYHHTKVQHIDFQNLEKNKIISICHGNEVADRIKILRTQILQYLKEVHGNSLLIASANPGEGRTVAAINLAIALSQQIDGTVLLVDADLRKPSVHSLLSLDVDRGLSDYLRGKAEIHELMINPGIPRLVVLPGGKPLPNSSELLGGPQMQYLVQEMKERYADRYIIFDSSPILTSADPLVLSRLVDGILLVVEAEKTNKDDLQRTIELLRDKPIIGTVFNKAKL